MKNLKVVFVLAVGAIFCSCSDFTEIDLPHTQLTGKAVYEDEVTAMAALSDIYARMRENGMVSGKQNGLTMLMGLYADDLTYYGTANSTADTFFKHTLIPSNEYVSTLWSNAYAQIYATNALFEGVSNSSKIMGDARDRLLGEALFIRAFLHFYLTNLYGEIPYITTTDYQINSSVSRMSEEVVYNNIINDLNESQKLLPETYPEGERFRANKAVAQAFLARVLLYREQWALAEVEATKVIDNSDYDMLADLNLVFLNDSPSTIWQFHSGVPGLNTNEAQIFNFPSAPPTILAASYDLVNAFDNNDLRKQFWLNSLTDGSNTWYHPYKYKITTNTGVAEECSIIFRIEEQYLIRAEARAHQGNIAGAREDLNKIRNRAGLANTTANTQSELLDAILRERRLEFFAEYGHRWFDLKRTGNAASVLSPLKPTWQNRDLMLPLPEKELILNSNLQPQNPGY